MAWRVLLALVLAVYVSATKRPHIITIVADDMGWNDVSLHGSNQIPTPNIDALAFSGVLLGRHYTLPSCTPSRAALLTGRYPIATGMQGYPMRAGEPRGLPLEVPTLPERLRELGYSTRMVGKWHLGCMHSNYTPSRRGFDSHFGYWSGYVGYFDHNIEQSLMNGTQRFQGHDFWRDLKPDWDGDGKYVTDLFTHEAQRIIASHDQTRPLFLHVAHMAVHSGNDSTPLEVPSSEDARQKFNYIASEDRQLYAQMVTTLDESVGAIVNSLRRADMLENSIIVFMSDNGGMTIGMHANTGSNWPLRGMKLTLFEGGVRGLAAVWSPLLHSRRRLSTELMHISDWMPTLYRAAGGDPSALGPMDGVDQWATLSGARHHSPRQEALINIDEELNVAAYIIEHWKLVEGTYNGGALDGYLGEPDRDERSPEYNTSAVVRAAATMGLGATLSEEHVLRAREQATVSCHGLHDTLGSLPCPGHCLFDLAADPCETRNVAGSNPAVVQALRSRLQYYRGQLVPQLNKPVDPSANPKYFNNTWAPWLEHRASSAQIGVSGGSSRTIPSLGWELLFQIGCIIRMLIQYKWAMT